MSMSIESKLSALFDYQKFEGNKRLADVIQKDSMMIKKLSDDDLNMVSAAGNMTMETMPGKEK